MMVFPLLQDIILSFETAFRQTSQICLEFLLEAILLSFEESLQRLSVFMPSKFLFFLLLGGS